MDELDPRHPRADHDQVLGHLGRRIGLPGDQDPPAIHLRPVRHARAAAGRQQHGVGVQLQDPSLGRLDDHLAGALERSPAANDAHLLTGQEVGHRSFEVTADHADPLGQSGEVEGGAGAGEPQGAAPPGHADHPAGGDHGLGRDAVPQVRRATHDVALDQRHLRPEPGGVGGGLDAGRAAPDDHEAHRHATEGTGAPTPVSAWAGTRRTPGGARRSPHPGWPRR